MRTAAKSLMPTNELQPAFEAGCAAKSLIMMTETTNETPSEARNCHHFSHGIIIQSETIEKNIENTRRGAYISICLIRMFLYQR